MSSATTNSVTEVDITNSKKVGLLQTVSCSYVWVAFNVFQIAAKQKPTRATLFYEENSR
jgi:hypothetical protein